MPVVDETVDESAITTSCVTTQDDTPGTSTRKRKGPGNGNSNARKHGLRGTEPPASARGDKAAIAELRNRMQEELTKLRRTSQRTLVEQATMQRAERHEMRARLAMRWLRKIDKKDPKMDEQLRLIEIFASATEARDKCIRELGLAANGKAAAGDMWDEIRNGSNDRETPTAATGERSSAGPPQSIGDDIVSETESSE